MKLRRLTIAISLTTFAFGAHAQQVETPAEYKEIEQKIRSELSQCFEQGGSNYDEARSCAASVNNACTEQSPDAETTAGMTVCAAMSAKILDDELNQVWSGIKGKASKEEFAKLLEKQRHWLEFRNDEKAAADKRYEGGTIQAAAGLMHYVTLTVDRVARLHEIEAGL